MADILEHCHQTEVFCIELIIEFFLSHNFQNTLLALKKDVEQSDLPLPDPLPVAKERIKKDNVPLLMRLLDENEHELFFEKWSSLVPDEIRSLTEYKKLTIYLYTYFATIQYRNKDWVDNENQNIIRNFAETFNENTSGKTFTSDMAIQKLEKTNGTFIIEKSPKKDVSPIEEDLLQNSPTEKTEDIFANEEAKEEENESSIREFEADSLENESDSINDIDFIELSNQNNNGTAAMDMFKTFLAENGTEFTNDPEFLPFFALPFIENPKMHPTFTKENWLINLKHTLEQFLINYSCGDDVIPRLVKFCLKSEAYDTANDSASLLNENTKRFKEVKRKLHRLKKDHQKLVGVASELSSALEKSVQGEAVNLKSTLCNCIQIFPDLFSTDISSNQSIKWHTWESTTNASEDKKCSYNQIDVRKLKQELMHGSMKNKLLLLQALRWYITKCRSEEREQIVSWFCRQDILGLKSNFISDSLAPVTLPHPVQQSVVRILNALASFNTGRDYIASSKITVQLLVDITKQSDLDSVTEDMIIATLQKLSLRRHLSDLMVKNGIMEWLLEKLDPGPLKKYTLEYSTSLIMNLAICIPPSFWDNREKCIFCIIKLLKTSHRQVVEFVCGTLCCIVRSDAANTICKNFGLNLYVTECSTNHKGDVILEKQIETLIKLHLREISPDTLQMNSNLFSDDDLEDPEELESEIDENDLVKGTPSGDTLLSEHYRLVFSTPSVVGRQPGKSPKLILRPSTPRSSNIPAWARSRH
ncbi:lisH domain-containing protein ARMC9-like isoform X2 [Rhodnius prolixus]|uniref:lisH domain-containing protein ARMC9-like isoform X2 n=1 Tax=Rhodnius prolixus TaxID=13249 RepID=UPI003D18B1AC